MEVDLRRAASERIRFADVFYVPIGDDGRFDTWLPARVYPVVSVDGAGYARDAMERWALDFDLTRDREEAFTIGRTELYGMHAPAGKRDLA